MSLVPALGTTKSMAPLLYIHPPIRYLYTLRISFLSHRCSSLNILHSLSLSSEEILQSLNHLLDPLLSSLQYMLVSLVLGSPALAIGLQMGLTSAEQRGRITSLDLLATLSLIQPKTHWLPCRKDTLLAQGQPLHTPRTFSSKLLPSQLAPSL